MIHVGHPDSAAFDQRVNQQGEGQRQKEDAADIELLRVLRARVAKEEQPANERGQADRHVDEKDRLPSPPKGMRRDQYAAEHLAADVRQAKGSAIEAERAPLLGRREEHADRSEHLRRHRRRCQALEDSRRDEKGRGRRDPAQQRRDREAGDAEQEQAPPAEQVPQPPAGDQEYGVGRGVSGDDELHLA